MKPKAGDAVRITTPDDVFEGTLLPRPDILSNDITVLKLTTGYNIGIASSKIKKVEVVKPHKEESRKKLKLKKNKNLPTVAILSTGGTISSRVDYRTGGVYADYTAEDFVAMCPELAEIANIEAHQVMSVMSEDFLPADWVKMAKVIVDLLPKVDGTVLTEGTDLIHYTSAALSFLLKDLGKPLIITGAQRSIDRGSSDAFMNLICSVNAAANWNGASVVTCMHGTMEDTYCNLIRGTKARKMHTSRRDAFRAINDIPLAKVHLAGKIKSINNNHPVRSNSKTSLRSLSDDVAFVYVHPNMDPGIIEHHIKQKVKGLVVAATALGHVPTNSKKSIIPVLKKAVKAGIHVVVTSQALYGQVHPYVYTNLRMLSMEVGATYLADIIPETAYAKMLVALKQKDPMAFMKENIAGEMSDREQPETFLI